MKHTKGIRYIELANKIRLLIKSENKLISGNRLPSITEFAKIFNAGKDTVSLALQQLEDDGLINIVDSSGSYISSGAWEKLYENTPDYPSYMQKSWCNEQTIWYDNNIKHPGKSILTPEFGYHKYLSIAIKEAQKIAEKHNVLEQYTPQGYQPLRRSVCNYLSMKGIKCTPDQVLITTGPQQSVQLLIDALLGAESMICDTAPSNLFLMSTASSQGTVGFEIDIHGDTIDFNAFEKILRGNKNIVFSVCPIHVYPSGKTLSAECLKKIMILCDKYRVPTIELDCYSDLYPDAPLPLKSLDRNDIVIYCGSIDRTLSIGIPVGWVVAPKVMIERLIPLICQYNSFPAILNHIVIDILLNSGIATEYFSQTVPYFNMRKKATHDVLTKYLGSRASWVSDDLGFHSWIKMKEASDIELLVKCPQLTVLPGILYGERFKSYASLYPANLNKKSFAASIESVFGK